MIWWAAVPHLLSVVAWILAAPLGRRLPPRSAAILLSVAAVSLAIGTAATLTIVGYIGVGDLLPIGPTDWSAADVRERVPVPLGAGVAAVVVGTFLALRCVVALVDMLRSYRQAVRALEGLTEVSGLTIIEDESQMAYAVPGHGGGRVVVSRGLLRRLSGPQRKALLAHEKAHLRHRHHWYAQVAILSAKANPLLAPLRDATLLAIERWADQEAVTAVGNPAVVAEAIGVSALAMASGPATALGAAQSDVVARVRLLLSPPGPTKRFAPIGVGSLVAGCWASSLAFAGQVYAFIEAIEAAAT
ncbi:MAG: M48 family metalloprotease [Nocardioides sp.]|uniref:M56 family metallopeptidase n=1 Tax=Nocardioides sp. TaxID=35761 RepID=UPI0039E4F79E